MRGAIAALLMLAAETVVACSASDWNPNEIVENEVVYSANGRYSAVVRRHEGIADFKSGLIQPPSSKKTITTALYETRDRVMLGQIEMGYPNQVLVSDSGRYVVTRYQPSCGRHLTADDELIAVYRSDGTRAGALKVGDVFNPHDVLLLDEVRVTLRHESDTREVIVIGVPLDAEETKIAERRIELATATMLDPKSDVFPRPSVFATPVTITDREQPFERADCEAVFDDPAMIRLGFEAFLRQAKYAPFPQFPDIGLKARIRGIVRVEVAVSERGTVLCARTSRFPFGFATAARDAVMSWRFAPHRTPFAGELFIHFADGAVEPQ